MAGKRRSGAVALSIVMLAAGCASRKTVLELNASVLFEKPAITRISHTLSDGRTQGGEVVVSVLLEGDAGLSASFDISPGILDGGSMREVADGRYEGAFTFPADLVGGPYTIVGRLRHAEAGEVSLRDPSPLTISLYR